MNNILVYLVLGLVACVAIGLAIAWVYNEFLEIQAQRQNYAPVAKIPILVYLKKCQLWGSWWAVAILWQAQKKKLKADPYRLELPNYTCSCEKRGLVVGVSGTGKTNYIFSQIVDWSKSGKSYVVTDIKPEIWGTLHANGIIEGFEYNDIVINPTDPKALNIIFWTMWTTAN